MINKVMLFAIMVLSGCAAEKQAESDAQRALSNNDYRLFQLPGRGNVLPGIETKERAFAAKLCGVKIVEETSDVVANSEELEKLQRLTQYAAEYNLHVYPKCQKAKQ